MIGIRTKVQNALYQVRKLGKTPMMIELTRETIKELERARWEADPTNYRPFDNPRFEGVLVASSKFDRVMFTERPAQYGFVRGNVPLEV